jgi:hypothetical protein
MTTSIFFRFYLRYLRLFAAGLLLLAAGLLAAMTYHWPLQKDAQVMHYINFLIDHGFKPYLDITDMNTPGAYMVDGLGMHVFGAGDVGLRLNDFVIMGLLSFAAIVIAIPYDWIAGLFAGILFALIHTTEGPGNTGERDEVIAMLVMLGYAFLFQALRRKAPWMMMFFGFCLGMASTIKPTVTPLGPILLVVTWLTLRSKREDSLPYMLWGFAGACASSAVFFGFLYHYHATSAFLDITRKLTPYYASLNRTSFRSMARRSLSGALLPVLLLAFLTAWLNLGWKKLERWCIFIAIAFGAASYLVQGKGYAHHRYPLLAFVLLWVSIELFLATKSQHWIRWLGVGGITIGVLFLAPLYLYRIYIIKPTNAYTESLETDLSHFGTDRLQRKVQCLDLIEGCLSALQHEGLVQSTGVTGDLLFFNFKQTEVTEHYRQTFWDELSRNPPTVIVLSNEWWDADLYSFDKLGRWPEFAAYIQNNYTLTMSREFPDEHRVAYRIYVRDGARLPPLS